MYQEGIRKETFIYHCFYLSMAFSLNMVNEMFAEILDGLQQTTQPKP
jgi:hypothetical protein